MSSALSLPATVIALLILVQLPSAQSKSENLIIRATGTGRTTGHIATLTVLNNGDQSAAIAGQMVFIPSEQEYQSYIGRIPKSTIVPPHSTVEIPVDGYCTDVTKPPVPMGESMPPPSDWIPVNDHSIPVPSDHINIFTQSPVEPFTFTSIPEIMTSSGFTPSTGDFPKIIPTWPGTNDPVVGQFNPVTNPRIFAPVIGRALELIEHAADSLIRTGSVQTPFSNDSVRERESLVQQTVWIYTSTITGGEYDKDAFTGNVYQQFKDHTGSEVSSLPEESRERVDAGVDLFWNAFQSTGVAAKILDSDQVTLIPPTKPTQLVDVYADYCIPVKDVIPHVVNANCKPNCSSCPLTESEENWLIYLTQVLGDYYNCATFKPDSNFCKYVSIMMERILAIEDRSDRVLAWNQSLTVAWQKWCYKEYVPMDRIYVKDRKYDGYTSDGTDEVAIKKNGTSTVNAHQAPVGSAEKLWWPSGTCIENLYDLDLLIRSYLAADGRIRKFHWTGHGEEKDAPCSSNPNGKGKCEVNLSRTNLSMKNLARLLKFKTSQGNCEIIINACYMGNPECAAIMQSLANETGCIVRAPKGQTTPNKEPDDTWSTYTPQAHAGPSNWDIID